MHETRTNIKTIVAFSAAVGNGRMSKTSGHRDCEESLRADISSTISLSIFQNLSAFINASQVYGFEVSRKKILLN